jgi:hypothetical protein
MSLLDGRTMMAYANAVGEAPLVDHQANRLGDVLDAMQSAIERLDSEIDGIQSRLAGVISDDDPQEKLMSQVPASTGASLLDLAMSQTARVGVACERIAMLRRRLVT